MNDVPRRALRPPPTLPSTLVTRFGEPEDVFGPNWRFRTVSAALGVFLVLLGIVSIACGVAAILAQWPPGGPIYLLLGGGLMTVGTAAVVLPRSVPPGWVFICPRGLVRVRGSDWEGISWAEVTRFEAGDVTGHTVTVRQCRLVTASGAEWGFIADWVADYPRLIATLRRKVDETTADDRE